MEMEHKKEAVLWALPASKLFEVLKGSEKGLDNYEASARLNYYGLNEIAGREKRHGLLIFLSQFKNALILVLIAAALISYFLQQRTEAMVIIAIVLLSTILGFFQEYRAERAVRELRKYISSKSKVLRNGEIVDVDSKEIVPGDIVYLSIGDVIPADIRLLYVEEMNTDESSLTGESVPVLKKIATVSMEHSLPQYLHNVAFMGTSVASGSGHGIVIATGKNTFFGKTAAYLKQPVPETDFQKNIRKFSSFLLKVILAMTLFIFVANAVLGKGIFGSFIFAIALAVGITPEVLPIIMTITLSNGALKMAKESVITKRLATVEDLGNVDILCCDKTGTLTEGELSVYDYVTVEGKTDEKVLLYGMLCSSSVKGKVYFENPIDKAIWQSKIAKSIEHKFKKYSMLGKNDFDFHRRRMSILVKGREGNVLITKGAPESVLNVCTAVKIRGMKKKLDKKLMLDIKERIVWYEKHGYRVISVAEKYTRKNETKRTDERDFVLLGFLLFLDPPKSTAKESLQVLQKLGVHIKVISGDSPVITRKICGDVGFSIFEERVITGDELEKLDEAKFREYSRKYNVFARVTPEQKYRIVSYLKSEGHILGFLGDGINDAPSLQISDVGISVDSAAGIAKEAADIILLKKSLKVLAHGIIEGRKTFGNIMKYILNTISANYGNMFTVAASSLFLRFIPLLPSQILLNNFLSDAPLLTVSTDNVDEHFLKKPKRWNMGMISKFMIYFGLISSFFDLALIIPLIFIFHANTELFRTAWFVESVLSEMVVMFAIRTSLPFFRSRPSKWLILATLVTAVISVGITFTIFGNLFFEFVRMPAVIVAWIAGVLIAYFITAEIAKRYFFKRFET